MMITWTTNQASADVGNGSHNSSESRKKKKHGSTLPELYTLQSDCEESKLVWLCHIKNYHMQDFLDK